jgi:hypothetical protein
VALYNEALTLHRDWGTRGGLGRWDASPNSRVGCRNSRSAASQMPMVQQSSMVNTCEHHPKAALVDTPIVTENTTLAGGSLAGVMAMTRLVWIAGVFQEPCAASHPSP